MNRAEMRQAIRLAPEPTGEILGLSRHTADDKENAKRWPSIEQIRWIIGRDEVYPLEQLCR